MMLCYIYFASVLGFITDPKCNQSIIYEVMWFGLDKFVGTISASSE